MTSTHLRYQGECTWWIISLWLQQHWVSHTPPFPVSSLTDNEESHGEDNDGS